jgi:hypothetical protein
LDLLDPFLEGGLQPGMHKALKFFSYIIKEIMMVTFEFGEFLALLPLLILIVDNNGFEGLFF